MNKKDVATFKLKSDNSRKIDSSIWLRKVLRQSVALSATLFHIVLEKVIRNIKTNPIGTIFNKTRHCLANADVLLILGRLVRATEEIVKQIENPVVTQDCDKRKENKICESNKKYNQFRAYNGRTNIGRISEL